MKLIPLLLLFLIFGSASRVRAGLYWADHSGEILFQSTKWNFAPPEPFTLTGDAGSMGRIVTTFSSSGGFWFDTGYKGSGSFTWSRPGYITSRSGTRNEVSGISYENGFGIPPAPPGSVLRAGGSSGGPVTVTSRFEHLSGGVLPAGSWIYFNCFGDNILTISADRGWMAQRFTVGFSSPDFPGIPSVTLLSEDATKAVYQHHGAVFIRTAVPLTEISASVMDPTPWSSYDGRTSDVLIDFAVAVAVPDNWVPPVRTSPFQITSFKFQPRRKYAYGYYESYAELSWAAEIGGSYSLQASPDMKSWTTLTTLNAQRRNETAVITPLTSEFDSKPGLYFRVFRN